MVISDYLTLTTDEVFYASIKLDESHFGWRLKGRGDHGIGQVIVFGILNRNGLIYMVVMDNTKSESLPPIIKKKSMPDSIVYTDSLNNYNKLDVSGCIQNHINSIKSFGHQVKLVLRKYNGIDSKFFPLFFERMRIFGLTSAHHLTCLKLW